MASDRIFLNRLVFMHVEFNHQIECYFIMNVGALRYIPYVTATKAFKLNHLRAGTSMNQT